MTVNYSKKVVGAFLLARHYGIEERELERLLIAPVNLGHSRRTLEERLKDYGSMSHLGKHTRRTTVIPS